MSNRLLALLLAAAAVGASCSDPAAAPADGTSGDQGGASRAAGEPPPTVPTLVEDVLTACVAPTPAIAESVDGDWEGFDVAVLEGVAEQLALELDVVSRSFDAIVSGVALNGGECDVAAAAVVDDDALAGVVTTSAPYRTVHRLVVTTSTSDTNTTVPPGEVTGRVGVEQDGPAADVVDTLTAAEVVAYPSQADLARALAAGSVDAALVGPRARDGLEVEVGRALALLATVPTEEETVLLLPTAAEDDLVEAVDEALGTLRDGGRLDALRDEWLRG